MPRSSRCHSSPLPQVQGGVHPREVQGGGGGSRLGHGGALDTWAGEGLAGSRWMGGPGSRCCTPRWGPVP